MPTYVLFIDRRKVTDIDKLHFGGPIEAFRELGKYPTGSFESFRPGDDNDPVFKELKKDPNYKMVIVSGN